MPLWREDRYEFRRSKVSWRTDVRGYRAIGQSRRNVKLCLGHAAVESKPWHQVLSNNSPFKLYDSCLQSTDSRVMGWKMVGALGMILRFSLDGLGRVVLHYLNSNIQ
jgi:hypothetical protein